MLKTTSRWRGGATVHSRLRAPPGSRTLREPPPDLRKLTYELELVESAARHARRDEYARALPVTHVTAALGYTLVEADRPGRFDASLVDDLGVPFGPERERTPARRGGSRSADRRTIERPQIVGEARAGRTLVLTCRQRTAARRSRPGEGGDLLIHEASFLPKTRSTAPATRTTPRPPTQPR